MNIELVCNNYTVPFTDLEWGGSAEQVCRTVSFSVPWNPHDSNFKFVYNVGDLVYLFFNKTLKFAGMVIDAEQKSEMGTIRYTAKDYMYHLIKSNGTYNFSNTTAEAIAKKICNEMGINYKNVYSTGINIKSLLVQNISLYDIILKGYTVAAETDGNKYMPVMDANYFTVIKRGQDCGLTLNTKNDITSSTHKQGIDNMVNQVIIYNDKGNKIGCVKNLKNSNKYGIFQKIYNKEEGVNANTAANNMLHGLDETASIEALGDIAAVAGKSIKVKNSEAGLTGTYYIVSDSHKFTANTHTMSLELEFNNSMEKK